MKKKLLLLGLIAVNMLVYGRNTQTPPPTSNYVTKEELVAEVAKQVQPHGDKLAGLDSDATTEAAKAAKSAKEAETAEQKATTAKQTADEVKTKAEEVETKVGNLQAEISKKANTDDLRNLEQTANVAKKATNQAAGATEELRNDLDDNINKIEENAEEIENLIEQQDEDYTHTMNKINKNKDDITKNKEAILANTARLNAHDIRLSNVERRSEQAINGVSAAVAMANLPSVGVGSSYSNNLSAAYGFFGGSHSVAIGLSGITANDRVSYKISTAFNTKGMLHLV